MADRHDHNFAALIAIAAVEDMIIWNNSSDVQMPFDLKVLPLLPV